MSDLTLPIPAEELSDLIQKIDKLVELILETDLSVAMMAALLDVRDSSKALADKMDES